MQNPRPLKPVSKRLRFGAALALACLAVPALAAAPKPAAGKSASRPDPAAVVREASSQIMSALEANKAKLKQDPALAHQLVRKYLVPHLAFNLTSQAVLGRYWRAATPAQRQAFKQAFLHYLITIYSKGVQDYPDAKVEVLPFRGDKNQNSPVRVRSRIHVPDHKPIEVDYAMVYQDGAWKVLDVLIAGVSFVKTYQSEYQAEVARTSLAALIKRLQRTKAPKTLTALKAAVPGTGR